MKKITLIILFVGATLICYSQQTVQDLRWDQPEFKRTELMKAQAPLSQEQMQKWTQVLKKYNTQIQELEIASRQSEIADVNRAMHAELNAIFTIEQRQKLDELRAKVTRP